MPNSQTAAYKQCGCCYSLWTHKEGVIAEINGIEEILSHKGFGYFSLNQVGSHMALHRPVGVVTFTSDNIDEMFEKIKLVNETVTITDTEGEDIYIRYTDFDYLRKIYQDGLEGK